LYRKLGEKAITLSYGTTAGAKSVGPVIAPTPLRCGVLRETAEGGKAIST
jgi:hypothetical protein